MKIPKKDILNSNSDIEKEVDDSIIQKVDETNTIDMLSVPEKEEKFNAYIEKLIRTSFEYKRYIGILKTEMDLTQCRFIKEADITNTKVGLEIHHYPFTLYDIVSYYREYVKKFKGIVDSYNTFDIANDIMKLHYEGKVGLVPLSLTVHELAHAGLVFIPLNSKYVFGNYNELKETLLLDDDAKQRLDILEKTTKELEENNENPDLSILKNIQTKIEMKFEEKPDEILKHKSSEDKIIA